MICLVAMVLGAIGVAMAMRAHLAQRMDILAVMKSIGARSSDILRIYLLQTTLLGLSWGDSRCCARAGRGVVAAALPRHAAADQDPDLHPRSRRTRGPLHGVADDAAILPAAAARYSQREAEPGFSQDGRRRRSGQRSAAGETCPARINARRAQWISIVVIILALCGIAAALSDSWLIARWFTLSLCVILLFILGLTAGLLRHAAIPARQNTTASAVVSAPRSRQSLSSRAINRRLCCRRSVSGSC